MSRLQRLIAAATWLALAGPVLADTWEIDHPHSRLAFRPLWEGIPFEGEFRRFRAMIEFDPTAPATGHFDVIVDIDGADAGGSDLNEGMALPEFFDTARHPQAHFMTTAIAADNGGYVARGTLTVKGVTRTVALPFTWTGAGARARLQGELVIDRTDFNVGEGEWAGGEGIGLAVTVIVDLALVRAE